MATKESKDVTVYIPKRGLALPDPKTIKTAREVAGKNPPLKNLKDHPEFDGQKIIITGVRQAVGDMGTYVLCTALVYPESVDPYKLTAAQVEDYGCIISTGSENFVDRVLTAVSSDSLPMAGTLRRGGRAWFLD